MKKIIQKYIYVSLFALLCQSCQTKENEQVKAEPLADSSFLIGKIWKIGSTKVDGETKEVVGFQNQLEIRFEAGGKGMVTYTNKELGKDSAFEWEISKDKKEILLRENQVIASLEVMNMDAQNFQYRFSQNGKSYVFNLKSL